MADATITALDRVLLSVAPQWARNRVRARLEVLAMDAAARNFEAATASRRTMGWSRRISDANAAAGPALAALRAHSRDLVRNDGWARNGRRVITRNTVGWGITSKPLGLPNPAGLVDAWTEWAGTTQCDAAGRLPFSGLQKLAMNCIYDAGEVLVRRRWRRPSDGLALPLQLQVLEPDYIDTNKHRIQGQQGGVTIYGIEFDAIGRRVAYWLFDEHPGSSLLYNPTSRRVPASEIIHVYDVERAGQDRGIPWLCAAIVKLKDFDEFEDGVLQKQKIAALLGGFIETVDGAPVQLGAVGQDPKRPATPVQVIEPAMVQKLRPGEKITFTQPPSVTDDGFSVRTLRAIAAAVGVTYEDLVGDYCVAPETRVLRADLRWIRADALRVGDALVAFDEQAPGGQGHRRKWRKAEVVRAGRRKLARRRIVTDAATVVVSDEHLFLCTANPDERPRRGAGLQARSENPECPGRGQRWVRADKLQPGDRILFLHSPWDEGTTHVHGYLKGMADGEGYLCQQDATIGIAQNPGVVFDETGQALRALGFSPIHRTANGGGRVQQWSLTGIGECLRFLGEVRPSRLLVKAETVYVGRMISGGAKKNGYATFAEVLSAESIGTGPVVTLETSTRTLITEGLLSHNSHVNFSSARMARLAHWLNVYDWQWNMLIPQFCGPAWRWAMEAAAFAGIIPAAPLPRAEWTPMPMPLTDPDKEARANVVRMRSGQATLPQVIREQGGDPAAVLAEIAAANTKLDELGIWLDSDPRRTSQAGLTQERVGAGGGGASAGDGEADDDASEPSATE